MKPPPLSLKVAGKIYTGWQSIQITRSMEALAGGFSLGLSERFSTERETGRRVLDQIPDGAECVVAIDDVPVITGFIDRINRSLSTTGHTVTVTGRDRAADLVDCSAKLGAWSFKNVNFLDLAQKIAEPYGVTVALQSGLTVKNEGPRWVEIVKGKQATMPNKYSIDPGDTAAEALGNLLRLAGLLAISDGRGGLILTRTGTERVGTLLVEGKNVLEANSSFDSSHRFRTYEVMGSHAGAEDYSGPQAAGVKGTATDLNARAGRTLIVRPETGVTPALAKQRAEWEASTRAARAQALTVKVQGWKESELFGVWPVNKLVAVDLPVLGVKGDALIAGVTFVHDQNSGTVTTLDLRNPKSFTPDPTIAKHGGGNSFWPELVQGV